MTEKTHAFTRRKALLLLAVCAAVLLVLILLRWKSDREDKFLTLDDREKFLISLGWEIDRESEEEKTVIIPDNLEGVMEEYNRMQLEQGLDLGSHCGEKCRQYTYLVKNYPSDNEKVYLSIYILDGELIAGDIHTNSVNGFMQGILPSEQPGE